MAEVLDFLRRQQQHLRLETDFRTIGLRGNHIGDLAGAVLEAGDRIDLVALQSERGGVLAGEELQRQDAHADQVRTMDALEAFGDHRLHAEQVGAFRRPVARGAGAVFLAGDHHQRHAAGLVAHRGVVDRQLLVARVVDGVAAFFAAEHQVLDADVGEGAAHHHVVVAAARAVGVEVGGRHAARLQELAGGRTGLDVAGRGNVVGGDRIAEQAEQARADDVLDRTDRHRHAVEVGRVLHVGRGLVPLVAFAVRRGDLVPARIALEHVGVVLREHLRPDGTDDEVADFLVRRPDVAQVHRLAVVAVADGVLRQVDVHGAGDRIGDHQRRRCQVVHLHFGMHAAFEVAVAR